LDASPSGPAPATTLEAVVERLLPRAHGMPSAREAKVAAYIETEMAKPELAPGSKRVTHALKSLDLAAQRVGKPFAQLPVEQQDEFLTALQKGTLHKGDAAGPAAFAFLLEIALEGYLCDPSHGGNAGGAAWNAIGFDAACTAIHPVAITLPPAATP
jgi:gluconate 2-dehydrogenase gamma chain